MDDYGRGKPAGNKEVEELGGFESVVSPRTDIIEDEALESLGRLTEGHGSGGSRENDVEASTWLFSSWGDFAHQNIWCDGWRCF